MKMFRFTFFRLIILFLSTGALFFLSCGKASEPDDSQLSDYPTNEFDPMMASYRQKFKEAKPITRRELALLRLGHFWYCQANAASRGSNFENREFKLVFQYEFDLVRQTNGGFYDLFVFDPYLGLASTRGTEHSNTPVQCEDERVNYNSIRITREGQLVYETFKEQRFQVEKAAPAIANPAYVATSYGMCSASENEDINIESLSGACRQNDDETNTEEGGCLDLRSGLVYSMSPETPMSLADAEEACDKLDDGGRTDWRLPSEEELVNLAKGDPFRIRNHFYFNGDRYFWTQRSGNAPYSWVVNLTSAQSLYVLADWDGSLIPEYKKEDIKAESQSAEHVCVRQPLDSDHDGVPDSSDLCPSTPKGAQIERSGASKGCADGETPSSKW